MSLVVASAVGPSPRAGLARTAADRRSMAAAIAWIGVCAVAAVAPFELRQPLAHVAGYAISSVEAVLFLALAAWAASLAALRVAPAWRTPLTLPWLSFLLAMTIAALAAPAYRGNALNMAGRLTLAFAVYLLVVNGAHTRRRVHVLLAVVAASGGAVAALAILEYLGTAPALRVLTAFREWVALVGAQVRAGGPLQYPTIASMVLEIAYAFALGLMLHAVAARRAVQALLLGLLAAAIAQGILVTFTRAGLITAAATLAIMAWRGRRGGFDHGGAALAALGAIFVVQFATSRSLEDLRLRLTTETLESWYRAEIRAPLRVELTAGREASIPVRLHNAGGATWDSAAANPFYLSYHWLLADDDSVVSWEGLRTPFPGRVAPGDSIALPARVEAPPVPGEYRLMWDVEQQHRLWFSTEPGAPLYVTRATVSGPPVGQVKTLSRMTLPVAAVRPGRATLWRAGAEITAGRPLLGIGPDNYRLRYGEHAGLTNFDRRVHSNNMYLEMLVGGGVLGGLAFAWLCAAAAGQVRAALRRARGTSAEPLVAALAAATTAIAVHGLVDSFWGFTPTYVLFAVTLGLTSASLSVNGTHAHRV